MTEESENQTSKMEFLLTEDTDDENNILLETLFCMYP